MEYSNFHCKSNANLNTLIFMVLGYFNFHGKLTAIFDFVRFLSHVDKDPETMRGLPRGSKEPPEGPRNSKKTSMGPFRRPKWYPKASKWYPKVCFCCWQCLPKLQRVRNCHRQDLINYKSYDVVGQLYYKRNSIHDLIP